MPKPGPRPLWRWWLYCVALDVWWRTWWPWAARLCDWCVLPEWLGDGVMRGEEDAPW